jgi:squalene-hopene/tetraprenyl-beta-curcumene cyclase
LNILFQKEFDGQQWKKRRSGSPNDSTVSMVWVGSFRRWSMLGLMAAGEVDSFQLCGGAEYLMRTQQADGLWKDEWFNAPGFLRVFYLKYHGYAKYFPLWALARYHNLRSKKSV